MKFSLLSIAIYMLFCYCSAYCSEIPENPDYFYFESCFSSEGYHTREVTMKNGKVYSVFKTNSIAPLMIEPNKVWTKKAKMTTEEVKKLIKILNDIDFCRIPNRLKSNMITYPHRIKKYVLVYKINNTVNRKNIYFENWPLGYETGYAKKLNEIDKYLYEKIPRI